MTAPFSILIALHLLFVVVWFGYAPAEWYIRKKIQSAHGSQSENILLGLYLKLGNLVGMIGSLGVLVTGVVLSVIGPWGFFQSHWISAKQIVMIFILLDLFTFLIPTASKISKEFRANANIVTDGIRKNLTRFAVAVTIQNVLILINFILGAFGASGLIPTV